MKRERDEGDLTPGGMSLRGMIWGWAVMNALLLGTLAIWSAIESPGSGSYPYFLLIALWFGFCSALVCGAAWLLVAWPLTRCFWQAMRGGEAWWWHGVRGALAGLGTGLLPLVFRGAEVGVGVLFFASPAAVVGGVAGGWTAWQLRRARMLGEGFGFETSGSGNI